MNRNLPTLNVRYLGVVFWVMVTCLAVMLPAVPAAAQGLQLEGAWRVIWEAKGLDRSGYRITQDAAGKLVFLAPDGARSGGRFVGVDTVEASDWKNTGKVSADGNTIHWDNGGRWIREGGPPRTHDLGGPWRAIWEAKGLNQGGYRITQDAKGQLAFAAPDGNRSGGRFVAGNTIEASDWKNTGKVSADGTTIQWDNGGRWVREGAAAPSPPPARPPAPAPAPPPSTKSLTGAWVHSADRNTLTPTGHVIILHDGDQVTKINSYKPFPDRSEWATLTCTGRLVARRLNMSCNWAPGGDPFHFGPPKGATVPWPENYELSADGHHLNGTGPQAHYYSRRP